VETWDAIRARRNVRSYGKEAIAPEDLDRILEAARRTPSAGNQQAWDFVVCTDPEQLAQLARVWRSAGHVAGSAATIALVAPNPGDARSRDLIQYNLGPATMSIMVAAADLGTRPSCLRECPLKLSIEGLGGMLGGMGKTVGTGTKLDANATIMAALCLIRLVAGHGLPPGVRLSDRSPTGIAALAMAHS